MSLTMFIWPRPRTDRGTLNMNGGSLNIGANFYFARDLGSIGAINLSAEPSLAPLCIFARMAEAVTEHINIEGDGKLIYTNSRNRNTDNYDIDSNRPDKGL